MNLRTLSCGTLLGLLASTSGFSQTINTLAGNGTAGYTGDGGSPTSAKLYGPQYAMPNAAGTAVYIADGFNHVIRKVSGGIITTIAGNGSLGYTGDGGLATNATLNNPYCVAIDASGNIYISDHNYAIRKVTPAGVISTIAGTGVAGHSGDGGPATAAKLLYPFGMDFDAAGNLYVGDQNYIRKITPGGIISTIAGNGGTGSSGDGGPATAAEINSVNYLTLDPTGNIFFSDNANHRVRKVSTAGIMSRIAGDSGSGYGGEGFAATATSIYYPGGLSFDPAGNLYFAESGTERVRKINTAGIMTTYAGTGASGYGGDGGPATGAIFHSVPSVTYDKSNGYLYVADVNNNRLRYISPNDNPPVFTEGATQSLTVCENATAVTIDTLLTITDPEVGQTETWSLLSGPAHGTVVAAYTATSTGGAITPAGLTYTPTPLYSGPDVFKIVVSDGTQADTTTINVTILPEPSAGIISGINSVCPGFTQTLSETVSGGIWSTSDYTISDISHGGVVKGVKPGSDTVIYTIPTACGIISAIFPFTVLPYGDCPTLGGYALGAYDRLDLFPNPNHGDFTLNIVSATEARAHVTIQNVLGSRVEDMTIACNKAEELRLNLPTGVYLLTATTGNQQWSKKIVINR